MFAIVGSLNRELKDVNSNVIIFYHTLIALFLTIIWLFIVSFIIQEWPANHSLEIYGWIALACCCDIVSLNAVTKAQ